MFSIPRIEDIEKAADPTKVGVGTFTVVSPEGEEIGRLSDVGKTPEGPKEEGDSYDEGPSYAVQLQEIIENATELLDHVKHKSDLPAWVQNKITLANHNIKASLDMYKSKEIEDHPEDCGCA